MLGRVKEYGPTGKVLGEMTLVLESRRYLEGNLRSLDLWKV